MLHDAKQLAREHWSRQSIAGIVIQAITASKSGKGTALPAGRAAEAILALLAPSLAFASQQAPVGWRLVPIDPTPEIIAAILPKIGNPTDADRALASKALAILGVEFNPVGLTVAADLARDYRAMLDAAASATKVEVG